MYYCIYKSKIGVLYIISDGVNLCGCYLEGQKNFPKDLSNYIYNDSLEILNKCMIWLDKYFNGEVPNLEDISIKFQGTQFRKDVWSLIMKIPHGKLVTYKYISEKIAEDRRLKTMSSQAVGGAVGHNPILIFIPCHRVIGTNGSLTGYAAGIEVKKFLLNLENDNNGY